MFSKKADRLKLLLGENSKITGDVESPGTVFVEGCIIGNVLGGKVILSDKAYVRGDIAANSIIVGGKIDGHLKGKERVELKATGQVFGDIMTIRLSISEGAIFNGTAHMEEAEIKPAKKSENKVVEFFSKEIIKG